MKYLKTITAFYPQFSLDLGEPRTIQCELSIIELDDGELRLKTPFSFLRAYGVDDADRQIGRGFFATREECDQYLAQQYPHWKLAAPLMERIQAERRYSSAFGCDRAAELAGESIYSFPRMARGHKSVTPRQIRAAFRRMTEELARRSSREAVR